MSFLQRALTLQNTHRICILYSMANFRNMKFEKEKAFLVGETKKAYVQLPGVFASLMS